MNPNVGIIDSQSVKWGNNQSLNGVDSNQKVKGVKRHIVVDKNGFLVVVMVTVANIHDSKGIERTLFGNKSHIGRRRIYGRAS